MPDPEAVPTQVQAQTSPLEAAKAEARAEIQARSTPEAMPAQDTGGAPEGVAPDASPTGEVDWSNPEAREKYLAERYLPLEEHEKRKKDQLRNLQGELELAKQARENERRQKILEELDDLRERDPRGYADRIDSDAEARALIDDRASRISPDVFQRAQVAAATGLARVLFTVRPELEALASEGGEKWQEVVNSETGGPFGYIQRVALEEGKAAGVAEFKKSKEYRDAIAEAERRGAHGVIGDMAVDTPVEGDPVTTNRKPDFGGDALAEARWEAAQDIFKRDGRRVQWQSSTPRRAARAR